MQGKALATLAGVAVILASASGCGASDSTSSVSQPSAAPGAGQEAGRPSLQGSPQVKRLRTQARALQHRRMRHEKAHRAEAGSTEAKPAPHFAHHDSGGGAAQFRTPSGDNSIQESGVEADAAERARAAAALHAYLDLRAAHHWAAACEYMAASLIVLLERAVAISPGGENPKGCPAVLAAMSEAAPQRLLDELAEVDVGSLRLNGQRGFLLYHGPEGKSYAILLAKEAGGWKVTTMDGTVLP